jgi:hypothetical protein
MTHFQGKIPVSWSMPDIEAMDYFYEEFNDPGTMQRWSDLYGAIYRSGLQADYRRQQPACTATIVQDVRNSGLDLDHVGTSYYKMMPGDLLPYHNDTYARFIKAFNVKINDIWRVIVFMQDWQPGFLFEIDSQPLNQYPAGTFVAWQGDAPHMAGNLGSLPRYTLQITGVRL